MDQKKLLQILSLPIPALQAQEVAAKRRKCKRRRLVHFGVSVLLLWLGARYLHFGNPESISFLEDDRPWPLPSGVSIDHCAEWSERGELNAIDEFPYSAEPSFELPVSTSTLFFDFPPPRTSGPKYSFFYGTPHYRREKHLEAAKACLLERDGAKSGVGFLVTVTFPQTSDKSPLSINNLSTDLLIFSQTFGDLSNIAFKSLLLEGAVGDILAEVWLTGIQVHFRRYNLPPVPVHQNCEHRNFHWAYQNPIPQSLLTESANVTNSVGPIESTFSASKSLTLSTSNSALNFDVNLSNDAEGEATQLKLFNNIASFAANTYDVAHRFIRGNITLTSAKDGAATRFDIHARTSTSSLTLDVLEAPRNFGKRVFQKKKKETAAVFEPARTKINKSQTNA
ncbi:hypothetical protein DFH08DRAFT_808123 [Mycena albidolilacea]|uniref:Uncharacterized protein n=1 Tax=Mycena albidolilacea TaxID=1033008 RepID=A0AAD7A2T1_9AGAR|nr:hypothetical protein DFH08DRAFT_808123 [Mycena albidolilacea]